MAILVNINVPDLKAGIGFYTQAFGLTVKRHLGGQAAELSGWPVPVFLLEKAAGSMGAAGSRRSYQRHWTPVHLDVVVTDLEGAVSRAAGAGAQVEQDAQTAASGKIAVLADPFGHGLCLVQFLNPGLRRAGRTAAVIASAGARRGAQLVNRSGWQARRSARPLRSR